MSFSRKNQDGQAVVLMVISLAVLTGMAALVLDVGIWMRTDRRLQQTADAAALAGAQMLPADPAAASSTALTYANKNGGDVLSADIVVTSTFTSNDTISVSARKDGVGNLQQGPRNQLGQHQGRREGPRRLSSAGALRRADGRLLRSPADPELQRRPHADVQSGDDHGLRPDGRAGAFGMLNLTNDNGTPGVERRGRVDPPRLRQVPRHRQVSL